MRFFKTFTLILSILTLNFLMMAVSFAEEAPKLNTTAEPSETVSAPALEKTEYCEFTLPEEKIYDADFITVRRKLKVEPGEIFRVKVFVRNSGNMPWFSYQSSCLGPKMFLGTDNLRDHSSPFYTAGTDTGWIKGNRVKMDQKRVDPGKIASFTFWIKAGEKPDVYKQYMAPVLEGITWIDAAKFSFDVIIGEIEESPADLRTKMLYAINSGSVLNINLDGEKMILVDLSDQMMYAMLDDRVIRQFQVSTGKSATPTPTGVTSIMLKQEVRIAHKYPHYIMPKFLMFRAGGYGIHALPSLGNDGGVFWTEARNHIGIPVSHGCIRLLPEDANFMFDFAEIGTTVKVQW